MDQLDVPSGMSLIARTAGIGRNAEELQWDLNYLMQLWTAIDGAATSQKGAFLIYQESSLVIRAIRDYFHPDIGEILIDTDDVFEQAQQFMAHVMPGNVARVKRYHDDVPLFSRFQIEHQIESAYSRQVTLPSGGAVVIDHTEALVAVDVNSGRATKGSDIEETALRTNVEAADEVARQLRLRDLGGLIVIDFIDMESTKSQREVENRLRDALHYDRARVQVSKISRFGLLELSRQRLRPALAETSYITCPRCTGTGHIRSTESAALHILRILEEEAMKENTGAIHAQVPVDVATFLLNEKRVDIARIEVRHRINLVIVPNRQLETPQHEIIRLRHDQLNAEDVVIPSYQMAEKAADEPYQPPSAQTEARPPRQEAAVKGITPDQPAPIVQPKVAPAPEVKAEPGIIAKIFAWFSGNKVNTAPQPEVKPGKPVRRERGERSDRGERAGRDRGERGRNRQRDNREGRDRDQVDRKERTENPQRGQQPRRDEAVATAADGQQPQQREAGRRGRGQRNEGREDKRDEQRTEPRQPKAPRTNAGVTGVGEASAPAPTAATTTEGNGEGTRRRGRRGRGRGEPREEGAPIEVTATAMTERAAFEPAKVAEVPEAAAVARPMPWPVPMPMLPPVIEPVVEPVVRIEATVPQPVAAVTIEPQPLPVESIAVKAESAPISVAANLEQVGLVMIETAAGKTLSAPPIETSTQPLGRKPKAAIAIASDPLQMVETHRD
jgi:ribonuclease E